MSDAQRSKLLAWTFGVIAVSLFALSAVTFWMVKSHQYTLNENFYDQSGVTGVRVRLHYEDLLSTVDGYLYDVPGVSLNDVVTKFDVLYERVVSMPARRMYETLLDPETLRIHTQLSAALSNMLPDIDTLEDNTRAKLQAMHNTLAPMRRDVEVFASKPVQAANLRRKAMMESFLNTQALFAWLMSGFVVSALAFSFVIWRHVAVMTYRKAHLEEMTQRLENALDEAEAASNAKSDFLSHMSHELRTPMNGVLGFAQLLQMQNLNEQQADCTEQIIRSGNLLMHMIDQILELNRLISGEVSISIQEMSPADTITSALGLMENMAAERSITLGANPGMHDVPPILSDPTRVQQILLNLMSNAIKYNREDGRVSVGCYALDDELGWVRFTVQDTGEGIPPGRDDELFQPFNRLGRESLSIEGTGVGLPIVQQLVNLLHGRIGYHSRVGEGTTFWVDLPMNAEETLAYKP